MIIAIPAKEKNINSVVDERFGRAAYFVLYNINTNKSEIIDNIHKAGQSGVGTKVVEMLAEKGVKTVYAKEFGPKAKRMLEQMQIEMFDIKEENILVNKIIEKSK